MERNFFPKRSNKMNLLSIRLRGSITIINPLKTKENIFLSGWNYTHTPNPPIYSPIILMFRIFFCFLNFFIILIPFPYTHSCKYTPTMQYIAVCGGSPQWKYHNCNSRSTFSFTFMIFQINVSSETTKKNPEKIFNQKKMQMKKVLPIW